MSKNTTLQENAVVMHRFSFVNNKGETRTHTRKLVSKKLSKSTDESILFYVYEPDDTEYGLMSVSVDQFNKLIATGEFKIAS
jgi:hypothetical protein